MDRGRIIDNLQNTNARFIDNYGASNKTSVRTTNPPGGKSSFSLGWTEPEVQPINRNRNMNNNASSNINNNFNHNDNNNNFNNSVPMNNNYNANNYDSNQANIPKTGVRVKYAPGGTSNIVFGTDSTNYDDYRKNAKK